MKKLIKLIKDDKRIEVINYVVKNSIKSQDVFKYLGEKNDFKTLSKFSAMMQNVIVDKKN